jgi:hypothetical protein
LAQIATVAARPSGIVLRIRVFFTGADRAGGVHVIPGCEVCVGRPSTRALLDELVHTEGFLLGAKDTERCVGESELTVSGFAVFAAGPRGLLRETENAVAP